MTKGHEFNSGSKISTALVAPSRSEIRTPFRVELPTLSLSTRKKLHRAAFVLTTTLAAVLSLCLALGLTLPVWAVTLMVALASVGFVYVFAYILASAEAFEEQKGGRR